MDFERIRRAWQNENARIVVTGDLSEAIATVRKKKRQFEIGLIASDVLETGAGLFVAYMFGVFFPPMFKTAHTLLYAAAVTILLLSACFVANRIYLHRLHKRRYYSVAGEIRYFLRILDWRIAMLRNILWWYLLPGIIAMALFLAACTLETLPAWRAAPLRTGVNFAFTVLLAGAVNAGVYYLNQRAVRKNLLPEKESLEEVLRALKEEG